MSPSELLLWKAACQTAAGIGEGASIVVCRVPSSLAARAAATAPRLWEIFTVIRVYCLQHECQNGACCFVTSPAVIFPPGCVAAAVGDAPLSVDFSEMEDVR